MKASSLTDVQRILVIRIDEIGDVVLSGPLLHALRAAFPAARLSLCVKPSIANLMERCPYVDEVLIAPTPPLRPGIFLGLRRHLRVLLLSRRVWWPKQFDLAILPRWDSNTGLGVWLLYCSGAPWRVAYSEHVFPRKAVSDRGSDTLLTDPIVTPATPKHEVLRNLDVARAVGANPAVSRIECWFDAKDVKAAAKFVPHSEDRLEKTVMAICTGAGAPKRQWPPERYAEVAASLLSTKKVDTVVIIGGPDDRAAAELIVQSAGSSVVNCVGIMSLRETAALLSRCAFFLGGDTGPMHLAVAAGAAVVCVSCHPEGGDPSHVNAPERFGPWTPQSRTVRPARPIPPCTTGCEAVEPHCILTISTDIVFRACADLLDETQSNQAVRGQLK